MLFRSIEAVAADLRRNGKESTLGHFAVGAVGLAELPRAAGRATVLRLGEADVLAKNLSLPLAAERELDQVLAFEMDRETPFKPEELYWNYRTTASDRQTGRLSLRLLVLPKASLDPLLTDLAAVGIQPRRVEIADGPDRGFYVPLNGDGMELIYGELSSAGTVRPKNEDCVGFWEPASLDEKRARGDRKSTRLNSSHRSLSRMPSSA